MSISFEVNFTQFSGYCHPLICLPKSEWSSFVSMMKSLTRLISLSDEGQTLTVASLIHSINNNERTVLVVSVLLNNVGREGEKGSQLQ